MFFDIVLSLVSIQGIMDRPKILHKVTYFYLFLANFLSSLIFYNGQQLSSEERLHSGLETALFRILVNKQSGSMKNVVHGELICVSYSDRQV